jgi:hypothetical protein
MMDKFTAYRVDKSPEIWDALVKGFGAFDRPVHGPGLDGRTTAIIGGLGKGSDRLLREARARGPQVYPYVFVDNGYIATHAGSARIRYRVVPNAYAHHWLHEGRARQHHRFIALGHKIRPWRKTGRHILVCLSSPQHSQFFGLEAWEAGVVAEIKRHTDRPVKVRRKDALSPLAFDLRDCWAVVAWSSKCAVDALLDGIPAFTGAESPAAPVASGIFTAEGHSFAALEMPALVDFRADWAAGLAWGQFTREEIESGLAASLTREWDVERRRQELELATA